MSTENTTAPEVKPAIPPVIAGITHEQVKAYFAELSAIAGFGVGFSAVAPMWDTWENFRNCDRSYACEMGNTPELAIAKHISARPLTGIALAQKKLADAQRILAEEQSKATTKETASHV